MPKKVDITGQRFGKLNVVKKTKKRSGVNVVWECKCDCGNSHFVTYANLVTGNTQSCGCSGHRSGNQLVEGNKNNWKEGTALQALNKKINSNNTSGIKGVSWHKRNGKWFAYIRFKYKLHSLGFYTDLEDAAKARKDAEEKYFKPMLEKYDRLDERNTKEV